MGVPVLTTPRLALRPPRLDDVEALVARADDPGVARMLTKLPQPYGRAEAEAFVADSLAPDAPSRWAIARRTDGAFADPAGGDLLGVIGLEPHLGYWLGRDAWGRGLASEAAEAVIRVAFADPERERIVSGHFADNAASRAVLTRLGFRETGRRRVRSAARGCAAEHADMALDRADWIAWRDWRIDSPRLVIDPLRAEDAPALAALGDDLSVARMLGSLPHPFGAGDALRRILRSRFKGRPGFRAAIRLRDGTLAGEIGVGPEAEPTVAFWLGAAHQGRGLGREAVAALIADIAPRLGLARVGAEVHADNPRSLRLLEGLGFRRVGVGVDRSLAREGPADSILLELATPSTTAERTAP